MSFIRVLLVLFAFASHVHAYYVSTTGRFVNRDPIAERGGANLYEFLRNDGVNKTDHLGLAVVPLNEASFPEGFTADARSGHNVGMGGYTLPTKWIATSKAVQDNCPVKCKKVVWDKRDYSVKAEYEGYTKNHEYKHIEDYASEVASSQRRTEEAYMNRCMPEKAAACYNGLTQKFANIARLRGSILADWLHLKGGNRGGIHIPPYASSFLEVENVPGRLKLNRSRLQTAERELRDGLRRCALYERE